MNARKSGAVGLTDENPQAKAKYNLNQLNRLSVQMKCLPREFIPEKGFEEKIVSGWRKQRK